MLFAPNLLLDLFLEIESQTASSENSLAQGSTSILQKKAHHEQVELLDQSTGSDSIALVAQENTNKNFNWKQYTKTSPVIDQYEAN